MGVWIEITIRTLSMIAFHVTPCMGVWIEIFFIHLLSSAILVTPCMGVWIEISDFRSYAALQ